MIEVSAEDFERANRGLVKLIRTVNKAGKDGISTRRLLQEIGSNTESQIHRAEREGYIRREDREPEGKGAWLKVNFITPAGKELLGEIANGEEGTAAATTARAKMKKRAKD